MPYITQKRRKELDQHLAPLLKELEAPLGSYEAGEINYVITRMLLAVWNVRNSYSTAAHLIGILDTAKSEFYRRAVVPYEEEKCSQNGDVYDR